MSLFIGGIVSAAGGMYTFFGDMPLFIGGIVSAAGGVYTFFGDMPLFIGGIVSDWETAACALPAPACGSRWGIAERFRLCWPF